jgi:dipeptidyl aminopeptidase/acylaminoacyl peptidase
VGYQGSIDLFTAWRKAKIPVELHVFQTGQHGFTKRGGGADHFMDRLEEWLKLNGWLKPVN